MRVLVLQHITCEPPGVYEDVLRERGAEIDCVELDEGEPLPDRRDFDAIVAMGGPMGAYDDDSLPWLAEEKTFIAEAVRGGVPFWGVCLGVQLLAASLGARVYPGPSPEVGLLPIELTDEGLADPVFRGLPRELLTLQWHGDTFDLPEGAVRLAGSPAYPNQAFRAGRAAYGVQFHVEVSPELAREWAGVPAYADALERMLGPGALDDLIGSLETHAAELLDHGRRLFERWLDVAAPASAPRDANDCGKITRVKTDYEEMASVFDTHARDSAYNAHYDRPAVLELGGEIAGQRALDAGCGPGHYAEELIARGAEVVAMDGVAGMVDLARKRLGTRAEVIHTDLNEPLPFAACEFDLIVCALVIHHLDDREACLREFFRVLRPGGHVVLSTQHPTTDWLRKGGSYFDVRQEEDIWHRDDRSFRVRFWREPLTSLCTAISNAGFLIERLVEPLPSPSMRDRWPEDWEKLHREPGFLVLRLLKP